MKIKILSLEIENFKGIKKRSIAFGESTKISGANATGKTSIFDAFTWLLFGKDSAGNEKFSIRPLDGDGNKVHSVEIKVSAILNVDGKELELSKTQKEKWVKKRGAGTAELQGNENVFEVDGYPKTEKEYKTFIEEILPESLFKILTNPVYFSSLPWKDQRNVLMQFATDISDAELATKMGGFDELIPELKRAPSTDDIQKKYAKALSEWKKRQGELPIRIDEVAKQKVDVDVAEMELFRNGLKERISENKQKQSDLSVQMEEYQRLSDGILELQFELNDMRRKANDGLAKQKFDLREQIGEKNGFLFNISNGIQRNNRAIVGYENDIESGTRGRNRLAELWKKVNAEMFDESTAICPTCHRELPEEERNRLLSEFEASKTERLARIERDGRETKAGIDNAKSMIQNLQKCNEDNKENYQKLEKEVAELEKQLNSLPESIDISDMPEAQEIQKQIAEKEKAMESASQFDGVRERLRCVESDLRSQLLEVEKQISKAENNTLIDERIAELQSEQREVAQKVADMEKMIYLLEQFIRAKMGSISAEIDAQFDGVSFKLFEMQLNGGMKECCEMTINGVPYGSLNAGHRIIGGLNIIRGLQKLYDAYLPIFVDNSESVNDFNFPKMENQMILLAVSEDKELKVVEG